jgi:hypothetical protein
MRAARRAWLFTYLTVLVACGGSGKSGSPDVGVVAGDGGLATRGGDRMGPLEGADAGPADGPADAPGADGRGVTDAGTGPDMRVSPDAPLVADVAQPPPDVAPDTGAEPDPCAANGKCELLAADYRAAVVKDQSCSTLLKGTCAEQRPNNFYCPCPVWVNTTTDIDAVRKQAEDAGCNKCRRLCPLIACRALSTGVCRAKTGGLPLVTGTCADQGDPVLQ